MFAAGRAHLPQQNSGRRIPQLRRRIQTFCATGNFCRQTVVHAADGRELTKNLKTCLFFNPDKYPIFMTVKVKLPWSGQRKNGKIRVLENS
jgi:hypothetical protein